MSEEQTKKITFEGKEYEVPLWVNWVARNALEWVYGYEFKPAIPLFTDRLENWRWEGRTCLIDKNRPWRNSLVEIIDTRGEVTMLTATQAAKDVFEKYARSIPVNPVAIAQEMGMIVKKSSAFDDGEFSTYCGTAYIEDGKQYIIFNGDDPLPRQRNNETCLVITVW